MYTIYNMFFSLIKWVLISFTLIFLVHHLYMYLTNILTVPKIKDLVNKPHQQYNDIFETLSKSGSGENTMYADSKISLGATTTTTTTTTMTNELSAFLNDLKKTKETTTNKPMQSTNVNPLFVSTTNNSIDYSPF